MLTRYLLRRAVHAAILLAAVSVISFFLLRHAPGMGLDELRLNPQISPQTVAALREQYGLNRTLLEQYLFWVRSVARGEGGISLSYQIPVSALVGPRMRNTFLLTLLALLAGWSISIPLGMWSAAHRDGWIDRAAAVTTSTLLAIPELVLACGLLLFAARTGWLRIGGLPLALAVLVPASLPLLIRHVRAAMLEVTAAPYISAARVHGIEGAQLWLRHILPAAANPLITLLGLSVAGLLSASLLVEIVTGWPGLGPLFLEAIGARDFYVVVAVVMMSALLLVIGNLLADVLLFWCDPRIRMS